METAGNREGSGSFDLSQTYVHLGLGPSALPLPEFRWDDEFLQQYMAATRATGMRVGW